MEDFKSTYFNWKSPELDELKKYCIDERAVNSRTMQGQFEHMLQWYKDAKGKESQCQD